MEGRSLGEVDFGEETPQGHRALYSGGNKIKENSRATSCSQTNGFVLSLLPKYGTMGCVSS